MARESKHAQVPKWEKKVGDLLMLLYQIEAVVSAIEKEVIGLDSPPNQQAHGLQIAAMTLVGRGLEICEAR